MLRWLTRWLLRFLLVLLLGLALLAAPIAYNEFACRADRVTDVYDPLITGAAYQRPEARTLLTYPEWHIVNAYDDYARVIRTGDPHDYGFLRRSRILGFALYADDRLGQSWRFRQRNASAGLCHRGELHARIRAQSGVRGNARPDRDVDTWPGARRNRRGVGQPRARLCRISATDALV